MSGNVLLVFIVIFGLIGAAAIGGILYKIFVGVRGVGRAIGASRNQSRQEALFKASFPELQPRFHPERILQFVTAWLQHRGNASAFEWKKPPGLGVSTARVSAHGEKGRDIELLEANQVVSRFLLKSDGRDMVIRLGPGKFTINVKDKAVRYWHPEREFKWSKQKGWRVLTSLSQRPIDSNDRGTTFSSDSPSSSFSSSGARAGAAAVAGAGGTFDGGGASDSWGEGSSPSESRTSY